MSVTQKFAPHSPSRFSAAFLAREFGLSVNGVPTLGTGASFVSSAGRPLCGVVGCASGWSVVSGVAISGAGAGAELVVAGVAMSFEKEEGYNGGSGEEEKRPA